MDKLRRLYEIWSNLKPLKFVIVSGGIIILTLIPIVLFYGLLNVNSSDLGGFDTDNMQIIYLIFMLIILAPIIETMVSQQIPILFIQRILKRNSNMIGIIISVIIFSLLHISFSIWYAIMVIPAGLILAVTFVIFQKRRESSFWMTSFIHAFRNLIALIAIVFEKS